MFEKMFEDAAKFAQNATEQAGKVAGDAAKFTQESAQQAGKAVSEAASKAADQAVDLAKDASKAASEAGKAAIDKAGMIANDPQKAANDAKDWAIASAKDASQYIKDAVKREEYDKIEALANSSQHKYSVWNSSKVMYFLTMVDGEVSDKESDKLNAVLTDVDPNSTVDKDSLIKECTESVAEDFNTDRRLISIQDKMERELDPTDDDDALPAKMLLWNMLAISYSDGEYSENEKQLIQYYAMRTEIPADIALEIESTLTAMLDVEKELDNVKNQKRYYSEIAPIVDSLNKRKESLFNNALDLILI